MSENGSLNLGDDINRLLFSTEGSSFGAATGENADREYLKEGDPCPICGGTLVRRRTEKGEFLGCSNFPECTFVKSIRSQVEELLNLGEACPWCGGELFVKRSRFGLFVGCSNFPECSYSNIKEEVQTACPMCRKGRMAKRSSRMGKTFYGCDNYPHCSFTTPGEPVDKPCPACGFPVRYKKKVKAGIVLKCPNPLCSDRRKRKLEMWKEE